MVWMGMFLITRTAETGVDDTVRECLQRGAHSPLLWSLVIEQILERLSVVRYPSWYADDIDIIKASLYDCLQEGVNNTKSWCSATR